jgi:hypothetical protein
MLEQEEVRLEQEKLTFLVSDIFSLSSSLSLSPQDKHTV